MKHGFSSFAFLTAARRTAMSGCPSKVASHRVLSCVRRYYDLSIECTSTVPTIASRMSRLYQEYSKSIVLII